jgi:hypothetical protein
MLYYNTEDPTFMKNSFFIKRSDLQSSLRISQYDILHLICTKNVEVTFKACTDGGKHLAIKQT